MKIATGALDLGQIALDFVPVYGEVVNDYLDPAIGVSLFIYFQWRGVSIISQPKRMASLLGSLALDLITFGEAPAWFLDVLYIHRTVKQEELIIQRGKENEVEDTQAENAYYSGGVGKARGTQGNAPAPMQLYKNGRGGPRGNITVQPISAPMIKPEDDVVLTA